MVKNFLLLFLSIGLLSSCSIDKKSYKKTGAKNIYKTNYDYTVISESKKSIKIAFDHIPDSLNPFLAKSEIEVLMKNALFPSLFYISPKTGIPEKNLVSYYDLSDDKKIINLNIIENLKFNDGTSLDASDIEATLSLLKSALKDTYLCRSFFINNENCDIKVLSPYKIEIKTESVNADILFALSKIIILPEEVVKKIKESSTGLSNIFEDYLFLNQISAGPYIIKKYTDEEIVLERNKKYFKYTKDGMKLPLSESIVLKIYQNNNKKIISFSKNDSDVLPVGKKDFNNLYDFFKNRGGHIFVYANDKPESFAVYFNGDPNLESGGFFKERETRKSMFKIIAGKSYDKIKRNKGYNTDYLKRIVELKTEDKKILGKSRGLTLRVILPEEEFELLDFVRIWAKEISKYKIKTEIRSLSASLFFETFNNRKDYDAAFFYFQSDFGLPFFSKLLKKENSDFPFFETNNRRSIEKLYSESLEEFDYKKNIEKKDELKKAFFNEFLLLPLYGEKKFYILTKNIVNFKVNTRVENGFDISTLEYLIKK